MAKILVWAALIRIAVSLLAGGVAQAQVVYGGLYPSYGDYHWRSPVDSVLTLPTTGNNTGDARVEMTSFGIYVWNGTSWVNETTGGTVTSVGLALPSIFTVSGSPVVGAGTLTGSFNTQPANQVFAGPNVAPSATPAFRPLVGADLPNPSATTLGGIESLAAVTSNWIRSISTSGVPAASQPAFSDISGTISPTQLPSPLPSTLVPTITNAMLAPMSAHTWKGNNTAGSSTPQDVTSSNLAIALLPSLVPIQGVGTIGSTTASSDGAATTSNGDGSQNLIMQMASVTNPGLSKAVAPVSHQFVTAIPSGVPTLAQPAFSDISGAVTPTQLPSPLPNSLIPLAGASALGGVFSITATASNWLRSLGTDGTFTKSQPAFTDISGTATIAQGGTGATSITSGGTGNSGSPALVSGTFAATYAGSGTNVSSVTNSTAWNWFRVGNTWGMSGRFQLTPTTANLQTVFKYDIPFTMTGNFAAAGNVGCVFNAELGAAGNATGVGKADTSSQKIIFNTGNPANGANDYYFTCIGIIN